jgi:hypothetical protein
MSETTASQSEGTPTGVIFWIAIVFSAFSSTPPPSAPVQPGGARHPRRFCAVDGVCLKPTVGDASRASSHWACAGWASLTGFVFSLYHWVL